MIKINLAKKRKAAGGGGAGFDLSGILARIKGGLPGGGGDGGEKKKLDLSGPVPKAIMAIAAIYFTDDYFTGLRTEELAKVDAQIAAVNTEKADVEKRLAKVKGFEPIKKELEEYEKSIRLKLEVLTKLLENRNSSSKIMMQIAQSIPEEVWLTELKVEPELVTLSGMTPGYNQVSDFIKSLSSTSQFGEISLKGIQESTSFAKDERVQTFELKAARRQVN